jgi:hypothetical protein
MNSSGYQMEREDALPCRKGKRDCGELATFVLALNKKRRGAKPRAVAYSLWVVPLKR